MRPRPLYALPAASSNAPHLLCSHLTAPSSLGVHPPHSPPALGVAEPAPCSGLLHPSPPLECCSSALPVGRPPTVQAPPVAFSDTVPETLPLCSHQKVPISPSKCLQQLLPSHVFVSSPFTVFPLSHTCSMRTWCGLYSVSSAPAIQP